MFDYILCFSIVTMKIVYLILTATNCFILVTSTGVPDISVQTRIVGGYEAKPHSHPYVISLQTRFFFIRLHICGGALLNEYYILSAAHCATESWLVRWLAMDAIAGMHNINIYKHPAQVIPIKERIHHPLYNGGIGPYDIALFKTISPFKFNREVKPIQLSTNFLNKPNESSLKLIGWGALRSTYFLPDLPAKLQEVEVTYIPFKDCYNTIEKLKEKYEDNPLDADSNLCTGSPTGGIVAGCDGDSGGPLIQINMLPPPSDSVEENTGLYNTSSYDCSNQNCNTDDQRGTSGQEKDVETVIVGIVSWGVLPCGEPGAPTIYTNVSNFIDFINYHI